LWSLRAKVLTKGESGEESEKRRDEWEQRHQAFHTAIVAGGGSQERLQRRERLVELAARDRFIWLRTTVLSVEMLDMLIFQHQTLVDAILARDAEQASALMREHLLTPIPIIQQAMAGKLSPQAG
ncbi:FCD domain-containing protein, partial [Klebsiella pneumoniae]|uniref:FCD domain-containing protein n=1 Tax=Klebsiella pneumoniae TaxID=573 RepID=UPI00124B53DF